MDAVIYAIECGFGATLGVWIALVFIAFTYKTFRGPPKRMIPVPAKDK